MSTSRRELKRLRKFLNKNRNWICLEDCKKMDPQCDVCVIAFLINSSYKVNNKADILTFRSSYLYEPFQKIYRIYTNYKNKVGWSSYSEERKKEEIMSYGNSCACM